MRIRFILNVLASCSFGKRSRGTGRVSLDSQWYQTPDQTPRGFKDPPGTGGTPDQSTKDFWGGTWALVFFKVPSCFTSPGSHRNPCPYCFVNNPEHLHAPKQTLRSLQPKGTGGTKAEGPATHPSVLLRCRVPGCLRPACCRSFMGHCSS